MPPVAPHSDAQQLTDRVLTPLVERFPRGGRHGPRDWHLWPDLSPHSRVVSGSPTGLASEPLFDRLPVTRRSAISGRRPGNGPRSRRQRAPHDPRARLPHPRTTGVTATENIRRCAPCCESSMRVTCPRRLGSTSSAISTRPSMTERLSRCYEASPRSPSRSRQRFWAAASATSATHVARRGSAKRRSTSRSTWSRAARAACSRLRQRLTRNRRASSCSARRATVTKRSCWRSGTRRCGRAPSHARTAMSPTSG